MSSFGVTLALAVGRLLLPVRVCIQTSRSEPFLMLELTFRIMLSYTSHIP